MLFEKSLKCWKLVIIFLYHLSIQMAFSKKHSTSQEALDVARGMRAYRTILTHFSQRYPRVPEGLDCMALPLRDRPFVAFDGLTVPFHLLPSLPLAAPAMARVMAKNTDSDDGLV
jgi:hypothetical protein